MLATPTFKKSGKYTVAELLTPVKSRISRLIADQQYRGSVLQRFRDLEKTIVMANLLAHDNPQIEAVAIKEVERFCSAVHKLHEMFMCPQCGSFIRYYQDLKVLRCPNARCGNPAEISC